MRAELENNPWTVHVYDIKSWLQQILVPWSRMSEVEPGTMQAAKPGDGTELRCEGTDGLQNITNKADENLTLMQQLDSFLTADVNPSLAINLRKQLKVCTHVCMAVPPSQLEENASYL